MRVVVVSGSESDPEGGSVEAGLHAFEQAERARRGLARWVAALAALGSPLWVVALAPEWFDPQTRRLVLALWGLCWLGAVWELVRGLRWGLTVERAGARLREP